METWHYVAIIVLVILFVWMFSRSEYAKAAPSKAAKVVSQVAAANKPAVVAKVQQKGAAASSKSLTKLGVCDPAKNNYHPCRVKQEYCNSAPGAPKYGPKPAKKAACLNDAAKLQK